MGRSPAQHPLAPWTCLRAPHQSVQAQARDAAQRSGRQGHGLGSGRRQAARALTVMACLRTVFCDCSVILPILQAARSGEQRLLAPRGGAGEHGGRRGLHQHCQGQEARGTYHALWQHAGTQCAYWAADKPSRGCKFGDRCATTLEGLLPWSSAVRTQTARASSSYKQRNTGPWCSEQHSGVRTCATDGAGAVAQRSMLSCGCTSCPATAEAQASTQTARSAGHSRGLQEGLPMRFTCALRCSWLQTPPGNARAVPRFASLQPHSWLPLQR